MTSTPWDFSEARDAARKASMAQRAAESLIKQMHRNFAETERAYRIALAKKIVELHRDGVAWSSTADLARGDEVVARLKMERDIAEGMREAASHEAWRATNDRQDVARFIEWSRRRDLAESPGPEVYEPVIGARA